jgi:hypothetical protein
MEGKGCSLRGEKGGKKWHMSLRSAVCHAPKIQKLRTIFDSMEEHAKFLVLYYCIIL